jgi:glycosyltransferase involved in cell wall biosynthesis
LVIRYFPTAGDQHGWAIDEDLRLMRRALEGTAIESSLARAEVVHAPFWLPLALHAPEVLRRRFVIAQADNPPFFYLTQPDFAWGQKLVDLWVARSTEAHGQFAALGLPSVHIPYAIDTDLFFPIADRASLRRRYGLPQDAYIIGNFHRDSEGADLAKPKRQKAPEMMVAILRRLRESGRSVHILLAGPRRHWIRRALTEADLPFTFVGKAGVESDDLGTNVLSRPQLNELYNACDLYLIPSRWEGGPQSAMEAAAARTKILSTPLGVARDILAAECFFETAREAADKIARDMEDGHLGNFCESHREAVRREHDAEAVTRNLRRLYGDIPAMNAYAAKAALPRPAWRDGAADLSWRVRRRLARPAPVPRVFFTHSPGGDASLDEVADRFRMVMDALGVFCGDESAQTVITTGAEQVDAAFRLLPAGGEVAAASARTCHVALAVQDAVNFRRLHPRCRAVVCPLAGSEEPSSGPPLVVEPDDRLAAPLVWQGMADRRVPVYPEGTAYYYQVFHGGISYGRRRNREDAVRLAAEDRESFLGLTRPPGFADAVSFWRTLLAA